MSGGVVVFVKTPGVSPLKTRLAADIGTSAAETFYRRSVDAVRAVVERAVEGTSGLLTPYWAVAEANARAHPMWRGWETLPQGAGELGARLSHIYDTILARHDFALLIGADAPQITPALLESAARLAAASGDFLIGPAEDGGFYLFGGSRDLDPTLWAQVPYSDPRTTRVLTSLLAPLGPIRWLPPLFDVDTAEELARLRAALAEQPGLLPEQHAVLECTLTLLP